MMKVLIKICALILLGAFLCALFSCSGKKETLTSIYDEVWLEQVEGSSSYTAVRELDKFEGMKNHQILSDSIVHFYQDILMSVPGVTDTVRYHRKHVIYNFVTDKVLLEMDGTVGGLTIDSCSGSYLNSVGDAEVFWVYYNVNNYKAGDYKYETTTEPIPSVATTMTRLYDVDGNLLAEEAGTVTPYLYSYSGRIQFGSHVFYVDQDGNLKESGNQAFDVLTASAQVGEFYYDKSQYGITAYDQDGNYFNSYTYRHESDLLNSSGIYKSSPNVFFLNNGNLLIQYSLRENKKATSYTYLDGKGNKYTLKTYLWDPVSGREKELELDCYIREVLARCNPDDEKEMERYHVNIENVASVVRIVDRRPVDVETMVEIWSVSNEGELEARLNDLVPAQSGNPLRVVAPGRYVLTNALGHQFLLDEYGEIMADLSGGTLKESFFIWNEKIYDYDLNVKYDFGNAKRLLAKAYDHCALLHDSKGYYLYVDGKLQTLPLDVTSADYFNTLQDGFVAYRDRGAQFSAQIYNDRGEMIFETYDNKLVTVGAEVDGCVLLTDSNGNYYRISSTSTNIEFTTPAGAE